MKLKWTLIFADLVFIGCMLILVALLAWGLPS